MHDQSADALSNIPAGNALFVVGIGASAGGVEALTAFFAAVPPDSGMAYVVILHLSPSYDSNLTAILQNTTSIPVTQVQEKVRLERNHVYVVSPNQHLTMQDGHLVTSTNMEIEDRRAPIDIFFRTLAESHTNRAIAVVLSGSGANGSMGIKRIKERGGAAFVQNPREAFFSEMPRNSIATELIDEVLNVADIPARIIAYRNNLGAVEIVVAPEDRSEEQQQALREIFVQIRVRTGHDFTNYKRPTMLRRIERRINIRNLPNLSAYSAYLRDNPEETHALLKDLLISVTNFFRDKAAFEYIENHVLREIVKAKKKGEAIRIWVAGCATGEEAYSLAMLFAERTLSVVDSIKMQIFATDIDEQAINAAREGIYTINDAADVSPERLRRFFAKEGNGYRIRREIREMILFATHNVLKDPPFSHIDLVTCRNMLIYLNQLGQERVMETFHFALNPGGYLFLGNSESADGANDLYASQSREYKVYQSRLAGTRPYPIPESVPDYKPAQPQPFQPAQEERTNNERISYGDLHQRLLEKYAPPSIILNEEYDILHVSESAGRFLQVNGGEMSRNLLKLVRPELRMELRSALYQATQKQTNIELASVRLYIDGKEEETLIHVRPVFRKSSDTARGFILVVFETGSRRVVDEERLITVTDTMSQQLEEELLSVKAQLRTTSEQYELQAEEMKASNEELQALNEELRSSAEELETSKEELQSINEELRTVNQELKIKIEEISVAGNNLQNLINSTDIGTLFLDRGFKVVLFTPAARRLFNLIGGDVGRPVTDITNKLLNLDLKGDAEHVLDTLLPVEREIFTEDERCFIMRMLPYRTEDDRINGVVVTFVDVTESKAAEREIQLGHIRIREILENTNVLFYAVDKNFNFTYVNHRVEEAWGRGHNELIGKNYWKEFPKALGTESFEMHRKAMEERQPLHYQTISPLLNKWIDVNIYPTDDGGLSIYFHDISEQKKTEKSLRESEERYSAIFNSISEGFSLLDVQFDENGNAYDVIIRDANPAQQQIDGLQAQIGKRVREFLPDIEAKWIERYATIAKTGEPASFEDWSEANQKWYEVRASRVGGEESTLVAIVYNDITERRFRESQQQYLIKLTDAVRSISNPVDIEEAVTSIAIEQFGADRCYYCAIEGGDAVIHRDARKAGLPPVAGTYPLSGFSLFKKTVDEGIQFMVNDIHNTEVIDDELKKICLSLQVISFINTPVVRNGKVAGILCLVQSVPRSWTPAEAALAIDSVERLWAAVERGKAEKSLRKSEERLRQATNAASIYSWEYELTTGTYSFSDNATAILGVRRLPKTVEDTYRLVYPADKDLLSNTLEMALTSGEGFTLDFRSVKDDGSLVWLSVQTTMLKDAEGNPVRLIGIAQDTSERKEAEDALRYSETKLRLVIKASRIGTWLWNIEENKYEPDEHTLEIFGNPPEGITRIEQITSRIYAPDVKVFGDAITRASEPGSKGVLNFEFRIVAADASLRWIQTTGQTFFGNNPKQAVMMVGSMTDITERRTAEEALRESDERYRAFFNQSTAGVVEIDTGGFIIHANDVFCAALGYSYQEMTGMNISSFTHPETLPRCMANFTATVEDGVSSTMEKKMIRSDGAHVWITETSAPLLDETGKTKSVLAVGIDVTTRKKTEIFIRESEERYRIALEAGELATWDWNLKTNKVIWNKQHFILFGVDSNENEETIDAEYFLEFVYPEDLALVKQQLMEVVGIRGIYDAEFRIRRKDNGKLRWMTGYGRVTEREGDKPIRVSGVMFDSTERREAEESLEATKNSLNTALEAAKMGVWTMNMMHGYMDRSTKHDELLGYQAWQEEWNHSKAKEYIIEEDKAKYDIALDNLKENGVLDLEARVKNPDGSICWIHYFGRTFRDDDGKGETAAGVIYDITSQKTIEKQKDEFIGVASHELKTPVTSIKAYAEILQEMFTDKKDFESAELMEKLDNQVDRLANLIKDLLDVTKISEGQLHLTTEIFDIGKMVTNIVEDMQRTTRQHQLRLQMSSLPDVAGDKERLAQVLINMLSNAIKYSPGTREINVNAVYTDGQVRISVQDFGIGMSPGTLEKLFARFFRSDNPTIRSFPGLGLGLFISMEIMKRHGGTISVESERGKGSVFTMILPAE